MITIRTENIVAGLVIAVVCLCLGLANLYSQVEALRAGQCQCRHAAPLRPSGNTGSLGAVK